MTLLLDKVPLWVRPVLGLALVVIGSILALHSSASIKIFVILVACGLITVGVSRIIGAFGKEPDEE